MKRGTLVGGRFEVRERAGRGGMGEVYRAVDTRTGERVALKLLTRADGAARFEREAGVLSSLGAAGVVKYVTHGKAESGEPFLAMEWLEGETLAQYLRRATLSVRDGVELVRGVARTLGAVHERGVVHRDLKPSNLFLVESDIRDVKVLDFGLARQDLVQPILTMTGQLVGTPGYISPEQARGDVDIDARTDVFALGCVLFRCLADRPPFAGTSETVLLAKVLLEEPDGARALGREISDALRACVERMLDKDPSRRPADGHAVAAMLDALDDADLEPPEASLEPPPADVAADAALVVLFVRQPYTDEIDTVPDRKSHAPVQGLNLRARAALHGLTHTTLATGADVMTAAGPDAAGRAARCALEIRSVDPGLPVALATARATDAGLPVGAAVERATILLEQRPTTGARIRVDEATEELLADRFEIDRDEASRLLLRELSTSAS